MRRDGRPRPSGGPEPKRNSKATRRVQPRPENRNRPRSARLSSGRNFPRPDVFQLAVLVLKFLSVAPKSMAATIISSIQALDYKSLQKSWPQFGNLQGPRKHSGGNDHYDKETQAVRLVERGGSPRAFNCNSARARHGSR